MKELSLRQTLLEGPPIEGPGEEGSAPGTARRRRRRARRKAEAGDSGSGSSRPPRRPHGRFRRWVVRPVVWSLAILTLAVFALQIFLNTRHARNWARQLIETHLGAYLDRQVTIDDLSFELLPFTVEVWGFTIGGPQQPGEEELPPFLHVPWASIDLRVEDLQYRKFRMSTMRVERPEIRLLYLPEGRHNLLELRRSGRQRRFEYFIDRLEVDRADLYLDHQPVRISLGADAVRARLQGLGEMRLGGQVVAQNLELLLPNAKPLTLAVSAQGEVQRGQVIVQSARISSPTLTAQADGTCRWSSGSPDKHCQFHTEAQVDGQVLTQLGYFDDLAGSVRVLGDFDWRPTAFGFRGTASSSRLVAWDRELSDVSGVAAVDRYGVRFHLQRALYAGGELVGNIDLEMEEDGEPVIVDLRYRDLTLDHLLADQGTPVSGLASRLQGRLRYRFPRRTPDLGEGWAEVKMDGDPLVNGLALTGTFPLRIEEGHVIADSARLASDSQSLLAKGSFDLSALTGRFDYEIASADVGELADLIPLAPETREQPLLWLPREGRGKLSGSLLLAPGQPTAEVHLDLEGVSTASLSEQRVIGAFQVGQEALDPFRLELATGQERVTVHGRIPFQLEEEPQGMTLAFDAEDLPLVQVRPWLPFTLPVDGSISGRLDLVIDGQGSAGRLVGTLTPATLYLPEGPPSGLQVDRLATAFDWDRDQLRFQHFDLDCESGRLRSSGNYRWQDQGMDFRVEAPKLDISGQPLGQYRPRQDLRGNLALSAEIGGSLKQPQVRLAMNADELSLGGQPMATGDSQLDLTWREGQLQASGQILQAVFLEGGGDLDRERADLQFDLEGRDLSALLRLFSERSQELSGDFAGTLSVQGALGASSGDGPEARLLVPDLSLDYRGRSLRALEPISLGLRQQALQVDSIYLGEESSDSEVFLFGTLPYEPGASLDLRVQSSLDTSWLGLVYPDLGLEGSVDLLGRLGGSPSEPTFDGQGRLRDARFLPPDEFPHTLEQLESVLLFYPDAVVMDHLRGRLAGGTVAAEGRLELGVEPASYRLQVRGENLRLRYPEGWALRGGGELVLSSANQGSGAEGALLSGRVSLQRLEYLEDLPVSAQALLRTFFERQRLEVDRADELLSSVALNIAVEASDAVRVRNNLADATGSADLTLRGTAARPVLFGEVEMEAGSQLVYNSTEYRVRRGSLTFADPYTLAPEVDLVATTRVRDFDITLYLSGPLERLETRFASEPPLPSFEVFRMLATGDEQELAARTVRRLEEQGEDQSSSAATFLYGQAASLIGQRVGNLFGFDKFRIDPLTESGDSISTARVTVGKRLSKDLFVTYSVDPSSTEDQRLRIEWQVERGLTLVLTQNGDESYSADVRWEKSF